MKKIFFILSLFFAIHMNAQTLVGPIRIDYTQYGANWQFEWDTVKFNHIIYGDGKGYMDSLGNGGTVGRWGIGLNSGALPARLVARGFGVSSADSSFTVQDGNGDDHFVVFDAGQTLIKPEPTTYFAFYGNGGFSVTDGSAIRDWQITSGLITLNYARITTASTVGLSTSGPESVFFDMSGVINGPTPGNESPTLIRANNTFSLDAAQTGDLFDILITGPRSTANAASGIYGFYYHPSAITITGGGEHYGIHMGSGYTRLGNVDQNDALTKIMALDAENDVWWVDASVLTGGGGGGGETNTASNLGGGLANFSAKVGVDLQFNTFLASDFNLTSNVISLDIANITGTVANGATTLTTGDQVFDYIAAQGFLTAAVTSVTGTANRITSSGGATPVIDIAATYVGQSSITTLGTIGTGVWNGTAIGITNGGTGLTSLGTANQLLGMDAAATAYEYKSIAFGSAGTAPAIVNTANTITFNFPLAAASVTSGMISNGVQSITGIKTFASAMIINVAGTNVFNVGSTTGTFRTTNGGSNMAGTTFFDVDNSNSVAGAQGFGYDDGTFGFMFTAANGTRRILRAAINITSLDNTAGGEDADLIFSTQANGTAATEKLRLTNLGGITINNTVTAAATTGAQTINKPSGSVNFAAAEQTLVVTNGLVTTNSIILLTLMTDDGTAKSAVVSASSAGSFTIKLNAAATAETKVCFLVLN